MISTILPYHYPLHSHLHGCFPHQHPPPHLSLALLNSKQNQIKLILHFKQLLVRDFRSILDCNLDSHHVEKAGEKKRSNLSPPFYPSRSCRTYVAHQDRQGVMWRIDIQRCEWYISGAIKASRIHGMWMDFYIQIKWWEFFFVSSEIIGWRVKAPQQRGKHITSETKFQKDGWMLNVFRCKMFQNTYGYQLKHSTC
jgi:hypothetical protein